MEKRGFVKRIIELNKGVSKNILESKEQKGESYEINLRLEDYGSIFSDFDPRPHSQRALSDDFLMEAKKISSDKPYESMELVFLIPKSKKNEKIEGVIKKRLHDHFKRHYELLAKDVRGTFRNGVGISFVGALLMTIATYFEIIVAVGNPLMKVIGVLFMPAGWFTLWFGLDEIFYTSRKKMPDLEFYEKMHKSKITFYAY